MIITKEDQLFLVKIFKEYLPKDFDVFDKESIAQLFKDVFMKLKKKYQLSGLCDVDFYINSDYGMIMEIEQIYAYSEELDVNVHFYLDCVFLSEIEMDDIKDYQDVYYYDGKFYGIYQGLKDSNVIYKDCFLLMEKGIKIC